jgi:2-alkyl-3-oxoalkanoate reductase
MRVCVTGATGFIGGALVRRLLNEGAAVRALARPSPRADALERLGVELIRGELADSQAVDRAVSGTDVVYHAAARVDSGKREDYFRTNVEGTRSMLAACAAQHVGRIVYLSSIAVYGLAGPDELIDENTPLDPSRSQRDYYAQSKIAADELVTAFVGKTAVSIAILRPGIVYGPGKPLPVGLLGVQFGKTNFVFGNSSNRIPLNYIENLVDAIQLAASPNSTGLRSYIVLDDDDLTLARYYNSRAELDQSRAIFLPSWPVTFASHFATAGGAMSPLQVRRAVQDRRYSTQSIRQELGWSPMVPLHDAISLTLSSR